MDLRIAGRRALATASRKGLGPGCARALAAAGGALVMNARGPAALAAGGAGDILVTNAGGPPPGLWSDRSREDVIRARDASMLTPIALVQARLPGMMARGWERVVTITSQSVKAPIPQPGLSHAARPGQTGCVAGFARQVAHRGVRINNRLPGIPATDRADALDAPVAGPAGITRAGARARRAATVPAGRCGTPRRSGRPAPSWVRCTPGSSSGRTSG
jgi:3-oxoacyl-[acyl-carrier protein] reductase